MSEAPFARFVLRPAARALAGTPAPPGVVTVLLAMFACGAGAALADGRVAAGGAAIAMTTLLAALPGELARQGKPGTPFGNVLQAVAGRYAEAAILAGMTVHAVRFEDWPRPEVIGGLALAASLTVAYAAARIGASLGQGRGSPAPVSFLEAQETRWAIAAVGAFSGQCYWALVAIAAAGGLATTWRLAYLRLRRIGLEA